MANWWIWW